MPVEPSRSQAELRALVEAKAKAMRARRRLQLVGALATVVAVLAVAVLAASGDGDSRTIKAIDAPGETTTTESPTTTETVAPTSAPAAPETTVAPSRTTTTVPPPLRWSGSQGGLRVEVTVAPSRPKAGDLVVFTVHAIDDDGEADPPHPDYGDGSYDDQYGSLRCDVIVMGPDGKPVPTTSPPPAGSEYTKKIEHGYRAAGDYAVVVTVTSMRGCDTSTTEKVEVRGTLTVAAGTRRENGPEAPQAEGGRCDQYCGGAPAQPVDGEVEVWASGSDPDGIVSRYRFQWGDGTPSEEVDQPRDNCVDDGRAWPRWGQDGGPQSPSRHHRYAQPGRYTVTVTATSTGCQGRDPQHATKTFEIVWP